MKADLLVKRAGNPKEMGKGSTLRANSQGARRGEKYILHDGPPYRPVNSHIGTGLNKILKDFIVRFHTMKGYDAPYVPWLGLSRTAD